MFGSALWKESLIKTIVVAGHDPETIGYAWLPNNAQLINKSSKLFKRSCNQFQVNPFFGPE